MFRNGKWQGFGLKLLVVLLCAGLTGCVTMTKGTLGGTRTTTLMTGQSKFEIMTALQQVGLRPKQEMTMQGDAGSRLAKIMGYMGSFSETERFVVLFKEGQFFKFYVQAQGVQTIDVGVTAGLKGYLLTRSRDKFDVKELK